MTSIKIPMSQVVAALELLREHGPLLGRPVADTLVGSRHKNMKELRILFAFDPVRKAILLIAGDKSKSWSKWYSKNIPIADDLLDEHLAKVDKK